MKISKAFLRIGIDARFVGPQGTGLGKYTEKLIENLQKKDKVNTYSIFLQKENWSYLNLTAKNFLKVLADVPWYSLSEQLKMPAIYNQADIDLLHVPHFNVPILYRKKFVVTIHDLIHHHFSQESTTTRNWLMFKTKRIAYRLVIGSAVKRSVKIIAPSNFVKSEIINNFKIDLGKVVVTYEAAEEEYSSYQKPVTKNKRFGLLYVGNAYPHKNLNALLDALKLLSSDDKPLSINLTIVSPRNLFTQRLKSEIEGRNLETKVRLLGYQSPQDLAKLFKSSSAYVFPSLAEGFGIPGLNAMASGIPTLASNIPTLKEVYQDAALYFDPQDPKDIARKIKSLLISPKNRLELVEKGKTQVKKYSWQKMAQETLEVYNSCFQ